MKDPMVAQTIGQNPQGGAIMAALQAHLAQHLGFAYRKQIEEKLGAPLPVPNEELPEDIEVTLAQLMAKAGAQLSQANQQQQQQQAAQQQAQDPLFQLQQKEIAIKEQEVQIKGKKAEADIQLRANDLRRKAQKEAIDSAIDTKKLQLDKEKLTLQAQKEGLTLAKSTTEARDRLNLDLLKIIDQQKGE
jgi:hypothetical protein